MNQFKYSLKLLNPALTVVCPFSFHNCQWRLPLLVSKDRPVGHTQGEEEIKLTWKRREKTKEKEKKSQSKARDQTRMRIMLHLLRNEDDRISLSPHLVTEKFVFYKAAKERKVNIPQITLLYFSFQPLDFDRLSAPWSIFLQKPKQNQHHH